MSVTEFIELFVDGIKNTTLLEYVAVFTGIISVWYSRVENILVYPIGLINTTIYIYLSCAGDLWGEATVNLYYTIMSIYGWYMWTKKDNLHKPILHITHANKLEWQKQIAFFLSFYIVIFISLHFLKKSFAPGAIPWADALASAAAFTAMWLMTRKKLESWIWWMITNIASIPLYFAKEYVFTSLYYLVLPALSVFGYIEWKKRIKKQTTIDESI